MRQNQACGLPSTGNWVENALTSEAFIIPVLQGDFFKIRVFTLVLTNV